MQQFRDFDVGRPDRAFDTPDGEARHRQTALSAISAAFEDALDAAAGKPQMVPTAPPVSASTGAAIALLSCAIGRGAWLS